MLRMRNWRNELSMKESWGENKINERDVKKLRVKK